MARICFIVVAGLDGNLSNRCATGAGLGSFQHRGSLEPVIPAVTSTMQATLSTGVEPGRHGIIANGLYTFGRTEVQRHLDQGSFAEFRRQTSFWEQANALVQVPRFWAGAGKRVAMLFWQQSMPDAADIVLTPKPEHTPDGKTVTACWSNPADLYPKLTAELGPFPLQAYWGPFAGAASTQWIVKSAVRVWKLQRVDLELVYLPLLDYNLQRMGPDHPAVAADLVALDQSVAELLAVVRADGGRAIVCGDYGVTAVSRCLMPNRLLRGAGLLRTRADEQGKLLVDYQASTAFAMVDHQVAHVYCDQRHTDSVRRLLEGLAGVEHVLAGSAELRAWGLDSPRSGQLVLLAAADAWFAHDWWESDAEKPAWQFTVDIHRKPGYDPREMFLDAPRRCIAQDVALVKGSHGIRPTDSGHAPVVLSDVALPAHDGRLPAAAVAAWLHATL